MLFNFIHYLALTLTLALNFSFRYFHLCGDTYVKRVILGLIDYEQFIPIPNNSPLQLSFKEGAPLSHPRITKDLKQRSWGGGGRESGLWTVTADLCPNAATYSGDRNLSGPQLLLGSVPYHRFDVDEMM